MKKLSWSIKELPLPLKFVWKISRNSSSIKTNYLVQVKNEISGNIALGEIAFNVRYGENLEYIYKEFLRFQNLKVSNISLEEFDQFLIKHKFPCSLSFGLESALTHLDALEQSSNVSNLFNLNRVCNIATSFSIPIMEESKLEGFFDEYNLKRFKFLKLKIGTEEDYILINKLLKLSEVKLRIDGNECFQTATQVLEFADKIDDLGRIEFFEQPLQSINIKEQKILKKNSPILLAADESVIREQIPDYFADLFDIVNIKLMKSGSYKNALNQIEKVKLLGLKVMTGCMVETSLGISSAMNLAELVDIYDLDGFLFLKEDPLNLINEDDGLLNFN